MSDRDKANDDSNVMNVWMSWKIVHVYVHLTEQCAKRLGYARFMRNALVEQTNIYQIILTLMKRLIAHTHNIVENKSRASSSIPCQDIGCDKTAK